MLFVYWVPYIFFRGESISPNDTTSTEERQIHSLRKYQWCGARKEQQQMPFPIPLYSISPTLLLFLKRVPDLLMKNMIILYIKHKQYW
jgi:hypothetical protein